MLVMDNDSDVELLREHNQRGSEEAFAALVSRHVDMVYSSALRKVRDPHLAEEIVQATFIIFARKASTLGPRTVVSAWLYRTAQFAAADALKLKSHRSRYELEASRMDPAASDTPWDQVAPQLDDAINQLRDIDRTAIVLRFFESKSLREVGAAMGLTDDTAQKRVARALEKLRAILSKRGVALSGGVLASALSSQGVQAAPFGVAASVVTATTLPDALLPSSIATIVKGTLNLLLWTRIKRAALVAAVAAAVVTLGVGGDYLKSLILHVLHAYGGSHGM